MISHLIGIGRGLAASPLPHHRTFGSRIRRFGGLSQGESSPQPEHRFPECQQPVPPRYRARSPTPRRRPSRHSTTGHDSCPPFRPSARSRGPTMPSADFCGAVREDCSALSPSQDTPQISRGQLSYRPCIDARCIQYAPTVDGGLCGRVPARPERTTPRIRFVSLAPHVRSTRPSDPTSR
jgi:hypothetical protein